MYNKIIKQTAKPVVLVQNMSSLNLLLFVVNYVLSRIKHTINIIKLTDESVCWSKYTISDLLSFYIIFFSSKRQCEYLLSGILMNYWPGVFYNVIYIKTSYSL